jgi:cytochrome b subunit of formate dehydrogenase/mono/diheme cytochrome c family protein
MTEHQEHQKEFRRFTASQRFEHILLLVTFTTLALTGLPQKYAEYDWAKSMIETMGGIESIRIVHRFMATLLMTEAIFHLGMLGYKIYVLGHRLNMVPALTDVRNVWDEVRYNLGLRRLRPLYPRYNYGEKAEYLAVGWGTLVMVMTGFMLWNPIAVTKYLPGAWIPAARAAHGAEAVLAVASILTWHVYNVHLKHFNKAMFTGNVTLEQMEEEHGEELEAIEKGRVRRDPPPDIIRKRRRYFWPYAAVTTVIMLAGLVYFVTFERSAITTVPRLSAAGETVVNVNPDTGNPEHGKALWSSAQCDTCHGPDGRGIPNRVSFSVAGTSVSFQSFVTTVRRGPAEMPAYGENTLTGQDLADLWVYIRSLPNN